MVESERMPVYRELQLAGSLSRGVDCFLAKPDGVHTGMNFSGMVGSHVHISPVTRAALWTEAFGNVEIQIVRFPP